MTKGGLEEGLRDVIAATHRNEWFARYRSDGCITLPNPEIFNRLRVWLKQQKTGKIPGTQTNYYGKVIVR